MWTEAVHAAGLRHDVARSAKGFAQDVGDALERQSGKFRR